MDCLQLVKFAQSHVLQGMRLSSTQAHSLTQKQKLDEKLSSFFCFYLLIV